MPKKKASGPLGREQLANLAEASLHGAVVLIADAMDLYQRGSVPHAYATAILAGEEFGKCQLAVGTIGSGAKGSDYWREWWATFYGHGPKLARAAHLAAAWVPTALVDAFVRLMDAALTTQRREVGLYVDIVDGEVVTPGDAISDQEAREAIEVFGSVIDLYDRMFKPTGLARAMLKSQPQAETMRAALDSRDLEAVREAWKETTGEPASDWQIAMIERTWHEEDLDTS